MIDNITQITKENWQIYIDAASGIVSINFDATSVSPKSTKNNPDRIK